MHRVFCNGVNIFESYEISPDSVSTIFVSETNAIPSTHLKPIVRVKYQVIMDWFFLKLYHNLIGMTILIGYSGK
jgi:hypothetical protein